MIKSFKFLLAKEGENVIKHQIAHVFFILQVYMKKIEI